MQALQFSATGSLDTLQLHDLEKPVPAAGEVLVEVRATGVNPSDIKNVLGLFPYTTTPRIPGRDFAGVIVEGPEELLGQAVWGGSGQGFGFYRDGCHAQYVAVPVNAVTPLPKSLTFAQAATCGVPFITAWDALERSHVKAGTRLLIIGAGAVAKAYSLEECAQMLKRIGEAFDAGLPAPSGFIELPLSQAVAAYQQVSAGAAEKIVLIP